MLCFSLQQIPNSSATKCLLFLVSFDQLVVVVEDSWGDICDHLTKSGGGMVKYSRQVTWIHYNNAGISQHSPNKDLKKAAYNK